LRHRVEENGHWLKPSRYRSSSTTGGRAAGLDSVLGQEEVLPRPAPGDENQLRGATRVAVKHDTAIRAFAFRPSPVSGIPA